MLRSLSELRRSVRTLVRDAAFSLPVFVCLALTIGAATAVFSVVDAVLLRPLPFPEPHRVRSIFGTAEQSGEQGFSLSATTTAALEADPAAFQSIGWWRPRPVALTGQGEARQLTAAGVGAALFDTLGVVPMLGGGFAERARAGENVVYLNEALWRQDFGADPGIVGRRIVIDSVPATVAGIVAANQALPAGTDLWLPLRLEEVPADLIHSGNLTVVARLHDAQTETEMHQRIDTVLADLRQAYPAQFRGIGLRTQTLRTAIIGETGRLLPVLLAAVGLLLALGSANVANLVLVRNQRQRLAVATRAALGGSRTSIIAWLVGELVVLGGAAAVAGATLALFLAPAVLSLTQIEGPGIEARIVDWRTLGFAAAVTLTASLAVGLIPALRASRVDLATVLRNNGARTSGGAAARRSQGLLIASQAAVGVLLVVVAGQTLSEVRRLAAIDPGFRATNVLSVALEAPPSRYPERAQYLALFSDLQNAIAALPGVEQVGGVSGMPVGPAGSVFSLSIEDRPPEDPGHVEYEEGYLVRPGYLETMGIELRAGRTFDAGDGPDGEPVVIVSESFARRYWPGEPAVGKRIKRRFYDSGFPWRTVVGVTGDVHDDGVDQPSGVALYFPSEQTASGISRRMFYVVRSARPIDQLVAEIRARVAAADPELPLARIATLDELVANAQATRRLATGLLGVFAAIGLFLLATGTYGVVAFAVAQRRGELGLRRALGAGGTSLVALVLRNNLGYLSAGTLVGLLAAAAASRLIDATLLPPASPALFVLAAALLLTVGTLAALQPAMRAVRLDPTASLRGGLG